MKILPHHIAAGACIGLLIVIVFLLTSCVTIDGEGIHFTKPGVGTVTVMPEPVDDGK